MKTLASCVLVAAVLALGCAAPVAGDGAGWSAELVRTVTGFEVPECAMIDPATGLGYVANIEAEEGFYWADDGAGFISRLTTTGTLETLRWQDGQPDHPLHAPKGLCVLGGVLYIADNTRVARVRLADNSMLSPIDIEGAEHLNDMAAGDDAVYVSDTQASRIHRITPEGAISEVKSPPSPNGVTWYEGRMYSVSWVLHEVYELDPTGAEEPEPFGVSEHFTNPDAIEVLPDGSFLVSDFTGNKIAIIDPDRTTVMTLIELEAPADAGINADASLLVVPQFSLNAVAVYRLSGPAGVR